jgi:hypothetical protein
VNFQGERPGFHPREPLCPFGNDRPVAERNPARQRIPSTGKFLAKFSKYFAFIFLINLLKTIQLKKAGDSLIWTILPDR